MRHLALVALAVAACGDNRHLPIDAGPADTAVDTGDAGNPLEPPTLFGTGLCVDQACTQISADVQAYEPQYVLWADGATKKRWMYLPPGTQIDTSNMDRWEFPQGTKFWKEFDVGGKPIETRYIVKIGAGDAVSDWYWVAYEWNAAGDDTTAEPFGDNDAGGTTHDIPPQVQCKQCHDGLQPTRILGFGAIQLDWDNPDTTSLDLDRVVAANMLTVAPAGAASPRYPLPGTATEVAALGYLHANCGHCHNPTGAAYTTSSPPVAMFLRLDVGTLGSTATTPTYMTAIDATAAYPIDGLTTIVVPGQPAMSLLIDRFETTNPANHMPKIASKMTDPTGDATLQAWVTGL
ncbi:MAG TPA: hypothetical protein VLX92_25960 [Kofleriaceae bacterium]|nr:hypothetical protein [Kofleriaceae bacterium]